MNTLASPPLSALLAQLFADADASDARLRDELAKLSDDERAKLMSPSADYRAFYSRAKDFHLAISRETGTLLYLLARTNRARSIVEFGTSFGISTLHLAAALRDNGGGRLVTTEFEPSKAAQAREHFARSGLADLIEIREGDALDTLARALPDTIDLVLLDGAKPLYGDVLALLEPRLRTGALVVADNADWSPAYLERVRGPQSRYVSVPFAADVELSMKL
ncbi:methyltransferase [Burkholderia sp. WAC0059]|uniref:O-methyltransferase n=1 Tax=Burkholderia sp. WAC0059 TaxID=2066022 RepID=UPI000C7EC8B2|nr:O-methyltransferase [Burkholderia sp. WAC0059]PLZ03095.1 methyltransferase [Burkholderia sp. WAC0059]